MLTMSYPWRGRAIPFGFLTFSSQTISANKTSRNLYHLQLFLRLKDLLAERPIVLDRAFSYLGLLKAFAHASLHFVIRLRIGAHPPKFCDDEENEVRPVIALGERKIYRGLWYKGAVRVHLMGVWKEGFAQPLWVMTDLEPEEGFRLYLQRMKIEEAFRDLKSLLGMGRLMNKNRERMEKMLALLLLVYAIAFLVGERLRDYLYGSASSGAKSRLASRNKWKRYSGLFVLLKQKWSLPSSKWKRLVNEALESFMSLVYPPVPT